MADIGKVNKTEITKEMKSAYLDYAMSVIVQRALPDVRDGLNQSIEESFCNARDGVNSQRKIFKERQDCRRSNGKISSSRRYANL